VTTIFQRVGPYEIVREIGRGGMAAVFLAEDTRHARQVALKLVPMNGDREGREILDAERWGARLQAKLAEECGLVPRVFEDGDHPPYYFIAMEYVDGENLSDLISRGRLLPTEVVRIASELCRFLDTAHRFNTTVDGREFVSLVHGDLKPRNVRLSTSGEIKVLDFGIAKALSLSRKVTRNDFGSMPYLSPERLESTEVDARADLWGFGVILYELLSGTPPFQAEDTRRLEQQIRVGYPRRPLTAPCPLALQAIVARLLAPQPSDRYPSAGAVLDDLRLVSSGHPTLAETLGFPGQLDEAPTTRTRPAAPDTEPTRRTRPVPNLPPTPAAEHAVAAPAPARPIASSATKTTRSHPLRAILMVAALLLVCNELLVGFSARRAAASAMTLDLDGLTDLWSKYDGLSHRSFLRVGVIGLERVLETRVGTLTDQVIGNYRSSLPTVRERQWRTAQRNLQQALVLAPRNASLKAALRYCEGHLHRIDGEAEKQRRRMAAANQHFTEAVSAFREAAELRRDWPDPFLGLARTFIYGLEDIDRGADAMRQAQKYGYAIGDRETAQLGHGYQVRGDSLGQTARRLIDLPQEAEYLQRAADAYRQALAQYERIPGYSGVAANLQRIHRSLDQLDERLRVQALPKEDDGTQPKIWP
jgi:serine/threonine protein kinase/tetratricopeptide (TPR) repeat protein